MFAIYCSVDNAVLAVQKIKVSGVLVLNILILMALP